MLNTRTTTAIGVLIMSALSACTGQDPPASENSVLKIYGVGWSGSVEMQPAPEAVLLEACVNDQLCASQLVLVGGIASAERWEVHRPPNAPEGAPQGVAWEPPRAGTCRSVVEWTDEIGTHACATVHDTDPVIQLEFFLDLSLVKDDLQGGDVAKFVVKDEVDASVLLQRTDVIGKQAPYYEVFDL